MTDFISTISGQFTRSLVLGTFFPVVIFAVLLVILLPPGWSGVLPMISGPAPLDPQWQLILFSLACLILSGLLYHLNTPLIRLYEGYPWCESIWGRCRLTAHRQHIRGMAARRDGYSTLLERQTRVIASLRATQDPTLVDRQADYAAILKEYNRLNDRLQNDIPYAAESSDPVEFVLPTELGNRIRAFECYAYREYGMDAVVLWPRLVAKIDSAYAAGIDDAKTTFDFMLNCSFLSGLVALLLAGAIGWGPARTFTNWLDWLASFAAVPGLMLTSWVFYRAAIGRAAAWGLLVKGAFDLYRFSLLRQLGFSQQPFTRTGERAMWKEVGNQLLHGDLPMSADRRRPRIDYTDYVG